MLWTKAIRKNRSLGLLRTALGQMRYIFYTPWKPMAGTWTRHLAKGESSCKPWSLGFHLRILVCRGGVNTVNRDTWSPAMIPENVWHLKFLDLALLLACLSHHGIGRLGNCSCQGPHYGNSGRKNPWCSDFKGVIIWHQPKHYAFFGS